MLYASELSGTGDAVAVIDPATGTVQARIQVGAEPGPLAMSDDGKYLYVGLTRDGAVRRVDLERGPLTFSSPLAPMTSTASGR